MQPLFSRFAFLVSILLLSSFLSTGITLAQSRPQRPDPSKGEGKRNQRPIPKTEEELNNTKQQLAASQLGRGAAQFARQ